MRVVYEIAAEQAEELAISNLSNLMINTPSLVHSKTPDQDLPKNFSKVRDNKNKNFLIFLMKKIIPKRKKKKKKKMKRSKSNETSFNGVSKIGKKFRASVCLAGKIKHFMAFLQKQEMRHKFSKRHGGGRGGGGAVMWRLLLYFVLVYQY